MNAPSPAGVPAAFFTLLGCELLGELLREALHLPIPGPVVGMFLLAAGLALRGPAPAQGSAPSAPSALDRLAGTLLEYMGLLFVPAGVGIIAQAGLLRDEWLPILGGLLGSTVLSLGITGFVMHRLARTNAAVPATQPETGVAS